MKKIRLGEIDTRAPKDWDKQITKEKTVKIKEQLNELQNLLYAENKHSLLVVLQGMDASGKDGVIRNVFGSLNPQGVLVKSFKAPTTEELSHDFLWRVHLNTPGKGIIQIFNRSHYEDVLITRVHKWCDNETAILGIYFLQIDMISYAALSFALAGSLAAFLIFNFHPAKIFMGDTGSLLIGLISAILVIKFIDVSSTSPSFPIEASPAVGFAVFMIPLLDTLRVFGIRIIHRRSPFSPDRNHVHHLLLDKNFTHKQITVTLVSINLFFIALAYFGRSLGSTWLILSIFTLFFAGIGLLYYTRPKQRLFVAKASNNNETKIGSSKILLTQEAVLEEK